MWHLGGQKIISKIINNILNFFAPDTLPANFDSPDFCYFRGNKYKKKKHIKKCFGQGDYDNVTFYYKKI